MGACLFYGMGCRKKLLPVFYRTWTGNNHGSIPAYFHVSHFNFCGFRVEFLIGTNGPLVDRIGTLLEVGASYIVLRLYMTNDIIICDLYSIKFVTVYGYGSGISNYAG